MPGSSPPPWIRRLAPGRPEFVAELLPYWRQTGHYSTQLSRDVNRRRSPTKRPSVKEGLWVNVILALVRLRQSCSHAPNDWDGQCRGDHSNYLSGSAGPNAPLAAWGRSNPTNSSRSKKSGAKRFVPLEGIRKFENVCFSLYAVDFGSFVIFRVPV